MRGVASEVREGQVDVIRAPGRFAAQQQRPHHVSLTYRRARRSFGRQARLEDSARPLVASVRESEAAPVRWVERRTATTELDCGPLVSCAGVGTESAATADAGVSAAGGCWPAGADAEGRERFRRRAERTPAYAVSVRAAAAAAERCVRLANAVDCHEQYFRGQREHHTTDLPAASVVATFRAPNLVGLTPAAGAQQQRGSLAAALHERRESWASDGPPSDVGTDALSQWDAATAVAAAASSLSPPLSPAAAGSFPRGETAAAGEAAAGVRSLSWDATGRYLAAAYCSGQSLVRGASARAASGGGGCGGCEERCATPSYVWDSASPNEPHAVLRPISPLSAVAFHPRSGGLVLGGCCNGTVAVWDLRQGGPDPARSSAVDASHGAAVCEVAWLPGMGGMECVSVALDGTVLRWDARGLGTEAPVLALDLGGSSATSGEGVTCVSAPAAAAGRRMLVGTASGALLSLASRAGAGGAEGAEAQPYEDGGAGSTAHASPVAAARHNPHLPQFFLSAGDWTSKVWHDDFLDAPVLTAPAGSSMLSAACWSPLRAAVFMTGDDRGSLRVHDLLASPAAGSQRVSMRSAAGRHGVASPVLEFAVSRAAVLALAAEPHGGRSVAVGCADGSLTLVRLSGSVCRPVPGERHALFAMLEGLADDRQLLVAQERADDEEDEGQGADVVVHARQAGCSAWRREADAVSRVRARLEPTPAEVEAEFVRLLRLGAAAGGKKGQCADEPAAAAADDADAEAATKPQAAKRLPARTKRAPSVFLAVPASPAPPP